MRRSLQPAVTILILLLAAAVVRAADSDNKDQHKQETADKLSTTEGEITVDGQPLKYKATAGQMILKDDAGKAKAQMFFVAYEKVGAGPRSARPITFVFNGGPGAAAVWLHLGTAGPKRIALDEQGDAPSPPYHLEDNPNTWLPATDLVFIDPVGTGFSRAVEGEKPEQFYGVEEDIRTMAEFIRLYTTRNERWLSPKFLAGESYGTTRAAGLSDHLLEEQGISLNGIVLISSVLNFRTLSTSGGNELPYALYLPSYCAVAYHFKKLPPDLQNAELEKILPEVEQWATHEYLDALISGSALSADARSAIAKKLARYTGLKADYIELANLRIDPGGFRKELLIDQRKVLGRFDARVAGYNPDPLDESADYDPSLPPYLAAYTATFNDYVRQTLKYETDRSYDALTGRVHPWNMGPAGNGFLDVATSLQNAMMKSPRMKVMFCNGYADLATPYLSAKYTIRHLTLSDALRSNITHNIYGGGHMLYHYHPSLVKLGADIRAFIREAAPMPATQPTTKEAGDKKPD